MNTIRYEQNNPWLAKIFHFCQVVNQNISLMIGFYGVIALLIMIPFSSLIAPYSPPPADATTPLLPPSWSDSGDIDYILGTNESGFDILSLLIYGIKTTFGYSLLIMLTITLLSIIIATAAATRHGFGNAFLIHMLDIFLATPSLILAIVMVVFLGSGFHSLFLSITLSLLPLSIKIFYVRMKEELDKEYITALRLDGARIRFILRDAVLPNILPTIIRLSCQNWARALLNISTFGYLGIGIEAPMIEWGGMLQNALSLPSVSLWFILFPGLAIMISVILIYLLGGGLVRFVLVRG